MQIHANFFPKSQPLRKIFIPLKNRTQHLALVPHSQTLTPPHPLLQIRAQTPPRQHVQLLAATPADAQLAPRAAPLGLAVVLLADHAAHGLERVVAPDVVLVRRVAL
jgi:hypothetical protein